MPTYPKPKEASLRILTWNVGRLMVHPKIHKTAPQRMLGKKTGLSAHASDRHLPHIARVILALSADIITLQEIGSKAQLEYLLTHLAQNYTAHISEDEEKYDRYVVILTKKDIVSYTQPIRTSSGRVALATNLPYYDLIFVGLHADAMQRKRRASQIKEILEWVNKTDQKRIILAGDFNLDLNAVGARIKKSNQEMYEKITEEHLLHDALAELGTTTLYYPRRLDYVFTNVHENILTSRVLRKQRKGTMDHHPIVVDFKF